ncbi:MAG: alpha/beta hydrolase fold domain-containing protein [Elainella sp.]
MMPRSLKILAWVSLLWIGLGLFLSSWIVIPAPVFALLPLGIGAPEISPLLLLANGVGLGLLLRFGRHHRLFYPALVGTICALLLSSLPLLQMPAALSQADAQMQRTFGADALTSLALEPRRSQPFSLLDLVTGLSIPPLQPERQRFQAADGSPLDLAIYRAASDQPHPALVAIYGGAWQRGDPSQQSRFNAYMAAQGYTVVAIDYRHAPQHRFPAQLEDVQIALQWVADRADQYQIDRSRIGLVGWSAGGHLALLAAYQTALPIRAVVSFYGPTDLTAGYADPPRPDPINTRAVLEALIGGSPAQYPQVYRDASPINYVRANLPPTLLIYGGRDHLVKPIFGQRLFDRLRTVQNRTVLVSLPWAEHAFDALFRGLGNQIALYYSERFLAHTLYGL